LKNVSLADRIENLPLKLMESVAEKGGNLSYGEKQLLCLCRSLLNHNRVIVLDEATSNMDIETDKLIQRTIKEKFKNQTVITIAHRLDTIIESDRIFVMKDGHILEEGTPKKLLDDLHSNFYHMVQETGPKFAQYLMEIVNKE
jgi:ABC-type multidrug transport system fused ATPase/permease subunit